MQSNDLVNWSLRSAIGNRCWQQQQQTRTSIKIRGKNFHLIRNQEPFQRTESPINTPILRLVNTQVKRTDFTNTLNEGCPLVECTIITFLCVSHNRKK
jgi:hypothetical protein